MGGGLEESFNEVVSTVVLWAKLVPFSAGLVKVLASILGSRSGSGSTSGFSGVVE